MQWSAAEGFSAKDLADLSGTMIYTVSRVLGEWKRRGFIDKGRDWVLVLDIDALLDVGTNDKGRPPTSLNKLNA